MTSAEGDTLQSCTKQTGRAIEVITETAEPTITNHKTTVESDDKTTTEENNDKTTTEENDDKMTIEENYDKMMTEENDDK